MVKYIVKELSDQVFDELAGLIFEFDKSASDDDEDKEAQIILDCVSILFNNNLIGLAFEAMIEEYDWWDWLVMCIVSIANIFLWFVSGGTAFLAKAVLVIMYIKRPKIYLMLLLILFKFLILLLIGLIVLYSLNFIVGLRVFFDLFFCF